MFFLSCHHVLILSKLFLNWLDLNDNLSQKLNFQVTILRKFLGILQTHSQEAYGSSRPGLSLARTTYVLKINKPGWLEGGKG
jgi:hypothetical protein